MTYLTYFRFRYMPIRSTVFVNDNFYHLYNRGVEKRIIFNEQKDYEVFLSILIYYLSPTQIKHDVFSRKPKIRIPNSVSLLCYCLMPNHYHFLIKQNKDNGITTLMHALGVTYSMYFNKKYERVGSLFQGRFKAKLIDKDEYLLQVSKYIHLNPKEFYNKPLSTYPYSSYKFYINSKITPNNFIETEPILSYFSSQYSQLSYRAFVEEIKIETSHLKSLLIDG